jgi:hypothetical protein
MIRSFILEVKKNRENRLLWTYKPVKNPHDNTVSQYYHTPPEELCNNKPAPIADDP